MVLLGEQNYGLKNEKSHGYLYVCRFCELISHNSVFATIAFLLFI